MRFSGKGLERAKASRPPTKVVEQRKVDPDPETDLTISKATQATASLPGANLVRAAKAAERRFDDVGDEDFLAQFAEIGAAALGQAMLRRNDQGELIAKDFYGGELGLLRNKRRDAEVQAIVQQFGGNVPRKRAAHGQMHLRKKLPVTGQHGQQGMNGAFVHAKRELAAAAGAEVVHGAPDFVAEIEDAFGIADQEAAGIGKLAGASPAGEQGFADLVFEFANGDADGGLGAVKLLRGAGEAALAGDREKHVKFR